MVALFVSVQPKLQNAMAITKAKKQDIVGKIEESLKNAVSVVFVRFNKISVADTSSMRKSLKGEDVGYYVAKKTLLKRVLLKMGYTGELPNLEGEVALAWSNEDATAPARGVYEHGKKLEGLSILGGVFEGEYKDATAMKAIAAIPSLHVLRGMFVNVINSPIQGLVSVLDRIREQKV